MLFCVRYLCKLILILAEPLLQPQVRFGFNERKRLTGVSVYVLVRFNALVLNFSIKVTQLRNRVAFTEKKVYFC